MTTAAVFAGESSGDLLGAALIRALQALRPELSWWGVGGPHLAAAGVRLEYDSSHWGALGWLESFRKGLRVNAALQQCLERLSQPPPALVVLVDFGGFNLHIARRAAAADTPVFWFMPPGAWRRRPRIPADMARHVSAVATPFPWSAERLREAGVNAHFVGHPLVDLSQPPPGLSPAEHQRQARSELGLATDRPVIAYFPASRTTEVRDIWPMMAAAARRLDDLAPGVQHLVGVAPSLEVADLAEGNFTGPAELTYTPKARQALAACDYLLTKSGTITLEAALFQRPMVITYGGNWLMKLEYRLFYRGRLGYIGLPNILAEEAICPELLERQANPAALAALLSQWLQDPEATRKQRQQLAALRARLGRPGAIQRAARLAAELVPSTKSSPSRR